MPLRNKHGTPIDPVPFLVVALLGVTVAYSYGPIYLTELGLVLETALLVCTVIAALLTGAAFHRYVWTARPELRAEVPVEYRLRRLIYGVVLGVAIIVLLSLPLVV
jgi:hypothetical protein